MSDVKSKVLAAGTTGGILAPISLYVASLITLDDTIVQTGLRAIVAAAIVGLGGFLAGWLKREHVIDEAMYDEITGGPEATPDPIVTPAESSNSTPPASVVSAPVATDNSTPPASVLASE